MTGEDGARGKHEGGMTAPAPLLRATAHRVDLRVLTATSSPDDDGDALHSFPTTAPSLLQPL